jgi:hypothetical protein
MGDVGPPSYLPERQPLDAALPHDLHRGVQQRLTEMPVVIGIPLRTAHRGSMATELDSVNIGPLIFPLSG